MYLFVYVYVSVCARGCVLECVYVSVMLACVGLCMYGGCINLGINLRSGFRPRWDGVVRTY